MFGLLGLLGGAKSYIVGGLVLVFLGLAGTVYIQSIFLDSARSEAADLSKKVADMKAAAALTEQLIQDNAKLTQERDDLWKELRNANDYDTPLSADVRRVLDRLQSGGASSGSP